MKIAITSLITRKVSRVTYGGTEIFTYDLIEELKKKGHAVTLYASSDSEINVPIAQVVDSLTAQKVELGEKMSLPYYLLLTRKLAIDSPSYDLIHNNFFNTYFVQAFAPFIKAPIVHTIHNAYFYNPEWSKVLKSFNFRHCDHIVFVSKKSSELAGNLPNSHVIYNGIDPNLYTYNENPTGDLLWLGRMAAEKGAHNAIMASVKSNRPLLLNAAIYKDSHQSYFDSYVKPIVNSNITIVENKTVGEKISLYQNAKAYMFPIQWEEPFGLVMAEAMACGTPVIAFARGATPEVIKDGETGFLVNFSDDDIRGDWIVKKTGIEGLTEAIQRVYSLAPTEYIKMRQNCRQRVESMFTIQKMVDQYEELYSRVVKEYAT